MQPSPVSSESRALLVLLVVATLSTAAAGCRDAPARGSEGTRGEAAPTEPQLDTGLVEGWSCAEVEACFALHVGRTRSYERRVGGRTETEVRTLVDRVPGADGAVFVESDGTHRFATRQGALALELRGQLIEALRFPARAGDQFTADDGAGNQVTMTVHATDAHRATPAGDFGPCLVHEARFENPEQPRNAGLRIETTLCEGIGEVERRIELPSMPLPVEFTLLDPGVGDEPALASPPQGHTGDGSAARGDRG